MLFRFANPEYLYLLFIIPIIIGWFIYTRFNRKKRLQQFGDIELLKDLMPGASVYRQIIKFSLMLLAFTLCIFVVARPQMGAKLEYVKKKGVEVMVVLDISNSMLAEDVYPNRLERAKQMLNKMLEGFNNDKVGVIVFAGRAFTQLPITSDYQSAKMFISSISTELIAQQGTAIGSAIKMACNSFSDSEKTGKSIIIITDAENHEDDARGAAKEAAEKGIQVNVIGIGKPEGSPIPIGGGNYKKDKAGNVVMSKLNESVGQEIAMEGNGIYVRADNSNEAMRYMQKELDKIAKDDVETKVYSEYDEQFPTIAWIALALLLLEFFLMEKKNGLFRNFKLFE